MGENILTLLPKKQEKNPSSLTRDLDNVVQTGLRGLQRRKEAITVPNARKKPSLCQVPEKCVVKFWLNPLLREETFHTECRPGFL